MGDDGRDRVGDCARYMSMSMHMCTAHDMYMHAYMYMRMYMDMHMYMSMSMYMLHVHVHVVPAHKKLAAGHRAIDVPMQAVPTRRRCARSLTTQPWTRAASTRT